MPHKDLNNLDLLSKILFLVIAIIAGIIHFSKRNLKNLSLFKIIGLLIYDCIVSGSISTFIGLISYGYTGNLAIALGIGGIAGHLGTRLLFLLELYVAERLKSKTLEEEIRKYNDYYRND